MYQWWEEHKEEVCPLNSSKLRWVIESILGLRTVSAVTPPKGKEKMLWVFSTRGGWLWNDLPSERIAIVSG